MPCMARGMLWKLSSGLVLLGLLVLLQCCSSLASGSRTFALSEGTLPGRLLLASSAVDSSKATHKYVVQSSAEGDQTKADTSKRKVRGNARKRRERPGSLHVEGTTTQGGTAQGESTSSQVPASLNTTEGLLRSQNFSEAASQAQAILTAHQQASSGQEKAVIEEPKTAPISGSSRELNPSTEDVTRSNAFKDLILSSSSQLSGRLPKVALLFLTRGDMPLEKTWRVFLESIPLQGNGSRPGWATLYSLYTHPALDFKYPANSLFYGSEVDERVKVEWGQFSVMAAEIRLFAAALSDPLNERFMLLSETCIPIFPATVIWGELLADNRSRINACANPSDKNDWYTRMGYRQADEMVQQGLERDYWRKSSQWVALTRQHALLVALDDVVKPIFERECYIKDGARFCVADEHYIPTMLSKLQRENETDCMGFTTHAWWDGPYSHPRSWQLSDVSRALILKLRRSVNAAGQDAGPCKCDEAIASAGLVFPDVVNVTAVQQRRRLLHQEEPSQNLNCRMSQAAFQQLLQELAVVHPYSSAWWSLLADYGFSIEEIEDNAYQESLTAVGVSQRRLLAERTKGLRHEAKGRHWDLAREFLQDYEAMDDTGCPLFARKFLQDSHEKLAEMATKLGVLEQAFLAAEAAQ